MYAQADIVVDDDPDPYFTLPDVRSIRFVDDDEKNNDIGAQLREFAQRVYIQCNTKDGPDESEISKLNPVYFDVITQTHLGVAPPSEEDDEFMGNGPEAIELDGSGQLGSPNILVDIVPVYGAEDEFQIRFSVYVNNNLGGYPKSSTDDIMVFYRVYFHMLLASFIWNALGPRDD